MFVCGAPGPAGHWVGEGPAFLSAASYLAMPHYPVPFLKVIPSDGTAPDAASPGSAVVLVRPGGQHPGGQLVAFLYVFPVEDLFASAVGAFAHKVYGFFHLFLAVFGHAAVVHHPFAKTLHGHDSARAQLFTRDHDHGAVVLAQEVAASVPVVGVSGEEEHLTSPGSRLFDHLVGLGQAFEARANSDHIEELQRRASVEVQDGVAASTFATCSVP